MEQVCSGGTLPCGAMSQVGGSRLAGSAMKAELPLHLSRLSRPYLKRLQTAWALLGQHLRNRNLSPRRSWHKKPDLACRLLCQLIQYLFDLDRDRHLSLARHAVRAAQTFIRGTRWNLSPAGECRPDADQVRPSTTHTPPPEQIQLAMA